MMGEKQHEERTVFMGALALKTPDERARYLDEACKGKPELRQRVEALLSLSASIRLPWRSLGTKPGG